LSGGKETACNRRICGSAGLFVLPEPSGSGFGLFA